MDLPLVLETRKCAEGVDEKNQEIEICFHQSYGSILHGAQYGTNLGVHINSPLLADSYARQTMSDIEETTTQSVLIDGNIIRVDYDYLGTRTSYITDLSQINA